MGCDIHSISQYKDEHIGWMTKSLSVGGDQRNYHSFSVMADVRNGHGVAGITTGNRWKPIAEPRGIPDDIKDDPRIAKMYLGDHSFSYLTLAEIRKEIKRLSTKKYKTVDGTINALDAIPYLLAVEKELSILAELVKVKPKDIRIVFGFDS